MQDLLHTSPPLSRNGKLSRCGFTLLEVLVSLVILTFGLLTLLSILQKTLRASEPVEFETRAALLAQSVLEGIRSDPSGFPFLIGLNPGSWPVILKESDDPDEPINSIYQRADPLLIDEEGNPFDLNRTDQPPGHEGVPHRLNLPLIFTIPGNGVDDDALLDEAGRWLDQERIVRDTPFSVTVVPGFPDGLDDQMGQVFAGIFERPPGLLSKRDYDGNIEEKVSRYFTDDLFTQADLIPEDPEEDDQDGDGLPFDTGDSSFALAALEDLARTLREDMRLTPDGDLSYDPQRGIDEEFANGRDDDGDGLIDEDLRLPSQLSIAEVYQYEPDGIDPSNVPYNYRPTLAGNNLDDDGDAEDGSPRDPRTGKPRKDGLDNDGNGQIDEGIDEEFFDGIDNDDDGRVDEDCMGAMFPFLPMPFPPPNEEYSFQIAVRRVSVAGDGLDDDNDGRADYNDELDAAGNVPAEGRLPIEEFANSWDDDQDGFADEDLKEYPASNVILVTVFIFQGDDRQDNDGDGWIDEEDSDGIDNDGDQEVDEDVWRRVFRTTGLVRIR